VGGTCDTHGGGERCLQGFGWEARREIGIDGVNWILQARDRVQWRVFVNTVINLRVP
jgi:hypothetical protein